ncbi:S-layer homology domain-containing protein [Paenibacillus sp. SAF-054]|uniref:S-layer homology domain-containing protein n=1 Tax=unclassified Paenibacillus TaxID=185978 RepID=UPI003F7D1F5C
MKKRIMSLLAGILVWSTLGIGQGGHASAVAEAFKDVPASHWAKAAIEDAVSKGFLKGGGNGYFRPNAAVTRAEFAAILDRVSTNEVQADTGAFTDLAGHWSEKEVKEAAGKGYFKAVDYPNGFKPNTPLTRVEMAKWMAEGLSRADSDYGQAIADTKDTLVPVAEYYKGGLNHADYPYVSVVLGTGLMTGYTDGTFGPGKTTTRAEVAAILMRLENVQSKKADAFRDLNEMREVGLTGSNLESLTPFRFVKNDATGEKYEFNKARNTVYQLTRNLGTAQLHRMIVVDASNEKSNSVYGKMFVDKSFDRTIKESTYLVFFESTIIPSGNNLDNIVFYVANPYVFLNGTPFSSKAQKNYGINVLPNNDHYVRSGFFVKDKAQRFWMMKELSKDYNGGENGAYFSIGNVFVTFKLANQE